VCKFKKHLAILKSLVNSLPVCTSPTLSLIKSNETVPLNYINTCHSSAAAKLHVDELPLTGATVIAHIHD
jgi:hypothetical protein